MHLILFYSILFVYDHFIPTQTPKLQHKIEEEREEKKKDEYFFFYIGFIWIQLKIEN